MVPFAEPPMTAQVTVWLELLMTVALKKSVPLTGTVVEVSETFTMSGGRELPPHAASVKSNEGKRRNQKTRRRIDSAPV